MNRAPPLFRSTSWADVEEENPPSPPRHAMPAPAPPPQWASDGPSENKHEPSTVVRKIETRPHDNGDHSNNHSSGKNHKSQQHRANHSSNAPKPTADGQRKLWEPASKTGGGPNSTKASTSARTDGMKEATTEGSWRRGETLPSADSKKNAGNGGGEKKKKKKSEGKRAKKPQQPSVVHELCIAPIPSSLTEDDIKKAFSMDDAIKRVKIVKDRAFLHLKDKEALDRAAKVKLPKWGDKEVTSFIPPPKTPKEAKDANSKTKGMKASAAAAAPAKAKEEKPAKSTSSSSAPLVTKKKVDPNAEAKKVNVFAAFDSSSDDDEEDEDEEDEDEEEDEEDDEQEDDE